MPKLTVSIRGSTPPTRLFFLINSCSISALQFASLVKRGGIHSIYVDSAREWRAAFILNKKPVPKQTPTLNTVVRLIAQRGGFLGRKHDGEPGAKTIWLDMRRLPSSSRMPVMPGISMMDES